MMRLIGLIVFLILTALQPALAERVKVRSGDHDGFSRLAFDFLSPVSWKIGRVERGYQIQFQGRDLAFDVGGVFRRISRKRIKTLEVSDEGANITLVVECLCYADAFEFRPGLLVVDIKDGPPPQDSPFETVFGTDEVSGDRVLAATEKEPIKEHFVDDTPDYPGSNPAESNGQTDLKLPLFTGSDPAPDTMAAPQIPVDMETAQNQEQLQNLAQMQNNILLQIGRATAQGLLEANVSLPAPETTSGQPETRLAQRDERERAQSDAPPLSQPHVNIRVENSIERAVQEALPKSISGGDGKNCLPAKMFEIESWGNKDFPLEKISDLRRSVVGEFDKADEKTVGLLVKAYIYAGFGAEAESVLRAFDMNPENADVLLAMSRIVDQRGVSDQKTLANQIACDSGAALWAALSVKELPAPADVNSEAITRAFFRLPKHLRLNLGPELVRKFLVQGDLETARVLRNAIARSTGEDSTEIRLLDARLDEENGHHGALEQVLEQSLQDSDPVSPEAMAELLEIKLRNKSEISEDLLRLAQSYAFEQKGAAIGDRLDRDIILAEAAKGNLEDVLAALGKEAAAASANEQYDDNFWEEVLLLAEENAGDVPFLKFLFSVRKDLLSRQFSQKTRRVLAARLLENGFADFADRVLQAKEIMSSEDRILLAKIKLAKGLSDQALDLLAAETGTQAAELRGSIYEQTGDFANAAQEYEKAAAGQKRLSAIWREGNWKQLETAESEPLQSAAKIMLKGPAIPDSPNSAPVRELAADRAMLKESATMRRSIEELLNMFSSGASGGS
ncbi:MAG TPA: hypothetical protein ENJ91_02155 [Rhodobacteraceae bacterium]|nr:hypothetical protein [Paracoccaceae bacterium]